MNTPPAYIVGMYTVLDVPSVCERMSSFKMFLTQTFPRCGDTCLPSRAMTQLFNGVYYVYRSVEVY